MAQYQRLRSGNSITDHRRRPAIALIELIFAIVIIAISLLSIPSLMNVAAQSSKAATVDDDVMARLSGWVLDKYQGRFDGNYSASQSGPLWLSATDDLNCSRGSGNVWYRLNPDSSVQCSDMNATPSAIPTTVGNGVNEADGNISKGIEKLNGGEEVLSIPSTTGGEDYDVNATYSVRYVEANTSAITNGVASTTWKLGSSESMAPNGSYGTNLNQRTHLKRVVTRFRNPDFPTDIVLTFYKSNKGN